MGVLSRLFRRFFLRRWKKNKAANKTKVSPSSATQQFLHATAEGNDDQCGDQQPVLSYQDEISVDGVAALRNLKNPPQQQRLSSTLIGSTDHGEEEVIELIREEEEEAGDVFEEGEMSIHVDDMTAGTAKDPSLGHGFQYHPSLADAPPPKDLPTSVRGFYANGFCDDVSMISLDPGIRRGDSARCLSPTSTIASSSQHGGEQQQGSSKRLGGRGGIASVSSVASGSIVVHDKHEEQTVELVLPHTLPLATAEEGEPVDVDEIQSLFRKAQEEEESVDVDEIQPFDNYVAPAVDNHNNEAPHQPQQEEQFSSSFHMHHDYHNNSDYYIPQHLLKHQQQQETDQQPELMQHPGVLLRPASSGDSSSYTSSPRSSTKKQRNSLLKYQQMACAKAAQLKQQLLHKSGTGDASVNSKSGGNNNNNNSIKKAAGSLIRQIRYIHAGDEDNSVSVVSV